MTQVQSKNNLKKKLRTAGHKAAIADGYLLCHSEAVGEIKVMNQP